VLEFLLYLKFVYTMALVNGCLKEATSTFILLPAC